MTDRMTYLNEFLAVCSPGEIADVSALVDALAPVWREFAGSGEASMGASKLARMESPTWAPPHLTFTIERHGAATFGSTRAELQTWRVDLNARVAKIATTGRRQIRPSAPRLDVGALAREAADLVKRGTNDPRIKWSSDRSSVQVAATWWLPSAANATMQDRTKRFHRAVTAELEPLGWESPASGRYHRTK